MSSDRTPRQQRRFEREVLKKARARYHGGVPDYPGALKREPRRLGMLVHTPAACSCLGCSGSRKLHGPPARELREPKE